MRCILFFLFFLPQSFAQNSFINIPSDSLPPFQIGNKWYFNVQKEVDGVYSQCLMTKEIIDKIQKNNYQINIIDVNYYYADTVNHRFEYWIWDDSSYSESLSIDEKGTVLYTIGQEDYYIYFPYTLVYTNIIDTIFAIISEGAIFEQIMQEADIYYWQLTKFALKIGLYQQSVYNSHGTHLIGYSQYLIAVRINNIFYGDSTNLTDVQESIQTVNDFQLFQNFPNPFNPSTTINYSVPKQSNVTIVIYDVLGRKISALVNEEKSIGNYTVEFNASFLSSGIYFYQMKVNDFVDTKKMILLR